MRGYLASTASEVAEFLSSGTLEIDEIYAPHSEFIAAHPDLDEEEIEFTLSLVAAEEAQELKGEGTGIACVLAFEITDAPASGETTVKLSTPLTWDQLQCHFEISEDGEELTWFATQEIKENLERWLK
jgi:hypothetical protein